MNLEQNLLTKILTLRRMMSNNESWNDIEETLTKLNMEYMSFDKFNKIFHLITKNIDRLVISFQHRMDERILICDVANILNKV